MPEKNFDFVLFGKPEGRIDKENRIEKESGFSNSGYIRLKLTTVDKIHIGSGFCQFNKGMLVSDVLQENGKAIIPGSSLKGAIRQIGRAVSDGCIPDADNRDIKLDKELLYINNSVKKSDDKICIICDMFGKMSIGSKVRISDFKSDDAAIFTEEVNCQFEPNIKNDFYIENGCHKGYKFYLTNCASRESETKEHIEYVSENSVFYGDVFFKNLNDEELKLLLFSLGLSKSISVKIGKYKAEGYGTVNLECTELKIGSKKFDLSYAEGLAKQYEDNSKFSEQISMIKGILAYKTKR